MPTAWAVIIDDFSVGPITVTGPAIQTQSGLDSAHVLGGSRQFDVGRFGSGSVLEIGSPDGLNFSSSGNGYFSVKYDLASEDGGTDLTQGGHDRFRLTFGEFDTTSFTPLALYVTLPPGSSSNGVSLYLGDWDDLILEFPFSAFPTPLVSAQNLTLDVFRNPPGASFVVESIVTAGPPIPGDFNQDGSVNDSDFILWQRFRGINTRNGLKFAIASADGNADGIVDMADYIVWRKYAGLAASAASQVTPEPGSLWLLAVAVLAAVRVRQS
jgi:hypothetical protein